MTTTEVKLLNRKGAPKWSTLMGQFLAIALGVGPLLIFMGIFFFAPLGAVLVKSLQDNYGSFSFENYAAALKEPFLTGFRMSISLAAISAITSAIPGAVFAYLIESRGSARIRQFVTSISGVLANTGGVPLAFMFIAALGAEGSATGVLKALGLDLYANGFNLFSFAGLILVYSYFQIPMMVIVFSPAVHGIRREWQEAARNLGANRWMFWRMIGFPLLFPSFVSSLLLLFASAFSAYATARAMTTGEIALVPILIGNLVDGNVIFDQYNLGKALAVGMVIVSAVAMIPYLVIQRRAERWQR
jgi:putative spermidine/putrescine transport system permease protein